MAKLQKEGVKKIIALGHSGIDVDKKIAKTVSGVDVVIGGHSDTFLFTDEDEKLEHISGTLDVSVVADYNTQQKRVYPSREGRIKFSKKISEINPLSPTRAPVVLNSSPVLSVLGHFLQFHLYLISFYLFVF